MITLSHYIDLIILNADGLESSHSSSRWLCTLKSRTGPNGDRYCRRQQPPPRLQRYGRPALHERYSQRSYAVQPVTPLGGLIKLLSNFQLLIVVTVIHTCTADDVYDGYFIPKGTIVVGKNTTIG